MSQINNPTDIDGCILWLDGSDVGTVTINNGYVTQWLNKSGSSFNLSNNTNGPSFVSNVLNGKSVLRFNNNQFLSGATGLNINSSSFAIFVLSLTNNLTSDMTIISKANTGTYNNGSFYVKRTGLTVNTLIAVPNNATSIYFPETYVGNKYRIISYLFNRKNGYQCLCENGQIQSYSVFTPDINDVSNNYSFVVGASNNTNGGTTSLTQYFTGDIAEIIIYKITNDMDDILRNTIEYYLASKWGLVNYAWDQMPIIYNANGYVGTYVQGFVPNENIILGYYSDNLTMPFYGSSNGLLGYVDLSGYVNMRNYGLYSTGDTFIKGNILSSAGQIYNLSNNIGIGVNTMLGYSPITSNNNTSIGNNSIYGKTTQNYITQIGSFNKPNSYININNNITAIGLNANVISSNQIVLGTSAESIYIPSKYVNVVANITTYGNNILTDYASFNTDINSSNSNSINFNGNISFFSKNVEKMKLTYNGNVGINTTTPLYKLDVSGTAVFSGPPIISGQNIYSGNYNDNSNNVSVGLYSLYKLTTGNNNSALGCYSLYNLTTGNNNSAMGSYSLFNCTIGALNSACGHRSLYGITNGNNNSIFGAYSGNVFISTSSNNSVFGAHSATYSSGSTFINGCHSFGAYSSNFFKIGGILSSASFGAYSLQNVASLQNTAFGGYSLSSGANTCDAFGYNSLNKTIGQYNVSFGGNSLQNCTTGGQNSSFGYNSSQNIVLGSNNVSFGSNSLSSVDCNNNTAIGAFSCIGNSSVNILSNNINNVSIGTYSLFNNVSYNNTAIGVQSLYNNSTGNNNMSIGYNSLYSNTTGGNNVAIGVSSGINAVNHNNNVFIGKYTGIDNSTNNWGNSVALGNFATIYANNQITLGGSNGNVHIPGYLYVSNVLRSAGFIALTSDYRIKNNIKSLDETVCIDFFSPVKYFNKKTTKNEYGFIADDIEIKYPFLIKSFETEEKHKFLNYNSIIGVITKDIIEMKKTNKTIDNLFAEFEYYSHN